MRKTYIILSFVLIAVSCTNGLIITDNEDKGVKEILSLFGGVCKYSIGVEASTNHGKKKYFELELSNSESVNKMANIAELPASGIAYAFYKNLKQEKSKYSHIKVVLVFNNEQQVEYEYPVDKLEIVASKAQIAIDIAELIKQKKFSGLVSKLNDTGELVKYDKIELVENLKKIDSQLGKVSEFLILGFRFDATDDGRQILHITGQMKRDVQTNLFSVDIDPEDRQERALLIEYKM